jgi:hypothetical protein
VNICIVQGIHNFDRPYIFRFPLKHAFCSVDPKSRSILSTLQRIGIREGHLFGLGLADDEPVKPAAHLPRRRQLPAQARPAPPLPLLKRSSARALPSRGFSAVTSATTSSSILPRSPPRPRSPGVVRHRHRERLRRQRRQLVRRALRQHPLDPIGEGSPVGLLIVARDAAGDLEERCPQRVGPVGAEQERRAARRAHARAVVVMVLGATGGRRGRRELVEGELDGHVRGAARAIGVGPDPASAGRASPDRRRGEGCGHLTKLREGSEHGEAGGAGEVDDAVGAEEGSEVWRNVDRAGEWVKVFLFLDGTRDEIVGG